MFEQQLVKAFATPPAGRMMPTSPTPVMPRFTMNRQCFLHPRRILKRFSYYGMLHRNLCLNLKTFWLIQCSICGEITILFVILTPQAPKESTEYGGNAF